MTTSRCVIRRIAESRAGLDRKLGETVARRTRTPSRAELGIALVAALLSLRAAVVRACGVSGPDGVWSCALDEEEEALRPRWHVGAAYAYTATTLRFGDELRTDQRRNSVVATAAYAPTRRLTFQASAGVAFAGRLRAPDGDHEFEPGPSFAAGATYRLLEGQPFLAFSGVLSAAFASTRAPGADASTTGYEAFDLRLGVVFGVSLFDVLSPYAVARVFGGPVLWRYDGRDRTGTDTSHFQLGAGFSLLIAKHLDLFFEGIPLGEQALSAGLAALF